MDLVLSVDTKKKEVVGDVNNGGHDWQITGRPEAVLADRLWMHTALEPFGLDSAATPGHRHCRDLPRRPL